MALDGVPSLMTSHHSAILGDKRWQIERKLFLMIYGISALSMCNVVYLGLSGESYWWVNIPLNVISEHKRRNLFVAFYCH